MSDKNLPMVSVVIPVFNEEKTIEKCLKSLSRQSVKPYEILIVDNNSKDKTIDISRRYNVRIISEHNQGIIFARRTGFDAAKGEIIASIDADTVVSENWTKSIEDAFRGDEDLLGISGRVAFVELSPGELFIGKKLFEIIVRSADSRRYKIPKRSIMYGSNSAIRRNVWESVRDSLYVGPDGVEVIEDIELSAKMLTVGRVDVVKGTVAKVHAIRSLNVQKAKRYWELGRKAADKHRKD